ncbi:MAG: BrnT family toxin [Mesorhizobium sp.]|nr:BrnT family toxin [Mesorhizobium sp.]
MEISYDPVKRLKTLVERGLDFEAAASVFAGRTYDRVDDRFDYGETRMISIGYAAGRMVVIVWMQRGSGRHVISMRKANEREQARYKAWLD